MTLRRTRTKHRSDLDSPSPLAWLTALKEQEEKYFKAFRNATEGGWCRVVIYPNLFTPHSLG
jgi:hypothetical protein